MSYAHMSPFGVTPRMHVTPDAQHAGAGVSIADGGLPIGMRPPPVTVSPLPPGASPLDRAGIHGIGVYYYAGAVLLVGAVAWLALRK